MNLKKIKILVFFSSFIFLVALINLVDLGKKTNYYNHNRSYNDTLTIQINFLENSELENKKVCLYFMDSDSTNKLFSKEKLVKTSIKNHSAEFNLFSKNIPNLLRINFDKNYKKQLTINDITIKLKNQEIALNPKIFISHPSIKLLKKNSKKIIIDLSPKKNIKYDPYIYTKNPINIHQLTLLQKLLLFIILLITSYLITEIFIYLLNFNKSFSPINSILLFLLFISLLFKEHWSSKILIIISVYTIFLYISNKLSFKSIRSNAYILFFLFALSSLIWTINVENSLSKLIGFLPFILIPLWVNSFTLKIKYDMVFKYIGVFYILVAVITVLFASFRFNTTQQLSEFYYHALSSPLSTNAIYVSLAYLFVLNFIVIFFLKKKELYTLIISIFLSLYILLLSSKMVIFLMFLSLIIIIFYHYKQKDKKVISIGIIFTLISLFLFVVFTNNNISKRFKEISNIEKIKEVYSLDEFGDIYDWNGLNLRLLQLRSFWDIEKDPSFNSLIGVGINNGQELLNERYKKYKMYTGKPWEKNGGYLKYNFHNQYAQTLIELGIIGFIFLLYIYYSFLVSGLRSKNILLLSIILTFMLIMLTESLFRRQKGVIYFVLFPIIAIKVNEYFQNLIIKK